MISLQLNITPTDGYAMVDGARCQVWEGRTPMGSECIVYVRWIYVPHGQDTREFDALPTEPGPPVIIEAFVGVPEPAYARGGRRDEEEEEK